MEHGNPAVGSHFVVETVGPNQVRGLHSSLDMHTETRETPRGGMLWLILAIVSIGIVLTTAVPLVTMLAR